MAFVMNSSFFGVDRGKRRGKMSTGDVSMKILSFLIPSKRFAYRIEDFLLIELISNLNIDFFAQFICKNAGMP